MRSAQYSARAASAELYLICGEVIPTRDVYVTSACRIPEVASKLLRVLRQLGRVFYVHATCNDGPTVAALAPRVSEDHPAL
jgi:hypothetical protein